MAFITLQQMYDAWKRVQDWVSGANTDKPKVQNVNSAGVEIFTAANPGQVALTGRKGKVDATDFDQALNLAAGNTTTITITPPVGELWRIKLLYFRITPPGGATAGTHSVAFGTKSLNSGRYLVASFYSNFSDELLIKYNKAFIATATASNQPANEQSQIIAIQSLVVTNASPLIIYYSNGTTGGTQTGTAQISVVREVEYIV